MKTEITIKAVSQAQEIEFHEYMESLNTGHCGSYLSVYDPGALKIVPTTAGATTFTGFFRNQKYKPSGKRNRGYAKPKPWPSN
jgi:hypothetical protein